LKTNQEPTVGLSLSDHDGSREPSLDLPATSYQGNSTFKPLPKKGSYGILLGNQPLDGVALYTPETSRPGSEDLHGTEGDRNTNTGATCIVPFSKIFHPSTPSAFDASNTLLSGFNEFEAEGLLNVFKEQMNPWFPFISVSESSQTFLRRERPFLLSSILAVSCRNAAQQRNLGDELVKQLTERVFIHNERGIDLLLSFLNYTGW
jgi:hypothetical protein